MLTYIVLMILCCFADRFSGGGFGWEKLGHDHGGPLRGRPLLYATIVLAIGLYFIEPLFAVLALGFFVWRSPGWKVFGGQLTPQNTREGIGFFCRHLIVGILLPLAYYAGANWKMAFISIPIFALASTMIGFWYSEEVEDGRDIGPQTEIVRGILFGVMLATLVA